MKRSDLVVLLNQFPDIEVGGTDGMVIGVEKSSYDDDTGEHNYIHLAMEDDLFLI